MRRPWTLALIVVLLLALPARARQSSPSVADDLAASVATMAKIGAAWSPSFSPDGERIAFISSLTGIPQVWTVETSGGWPTLVTALDDRVSAVEWSPDGSWLAFSLAPGGGLNEQIYIVRPDGTKLRRLTDGGKENNFLGPWTRDGRSLTFSSNRRDAAATDPYLVDPVSGAARLVVKSRGVGGLLDVSRDGRFAVLDRLISRGSNDLVLVDLASASEQCLTPHEGPGSFDGGTFSPDGQTVYLSSNKDRDLSAFSKVRIDPAGKPGPIEVLAERADAELQEFAIDEGGTTAALLWNIAGRTELSFLDLANGRARPGPALPAEIASSPTFSRDGHRLGLVVSGSTTPRDIWVLDMATGRSRQVTHSPHAGVDFGALVRPELVRYRALDGLELTGWLYRPRGASGRGPLVLSFHGGPEGQERPGFNSTYQALLARGISVFAPNVRGSSGFGKRFVNLDNGALRVNAVTDIKATVDAMVARSVGEPGRIGIMGGSYGGYMVLAGLSEYPELFAAGADLFGVVNFKTFFANSEPWMAAISTVEYGDPKTEAEMLARLSPLNKVDRVRAPTIVLHGANDTNVPVVEAEQVVEALRKRSIAVEYVLFPDEGHGFQKLPNRVRAAVAIVSWFEKYLVRGER